MTKRNGLSAAFNRPPEADTLERLVGVMLGLWVFGEIVFAHSVAAAVSWPVPVDPMLLINSVVLACLVAIVACRGFDFGLVGAIGLVCLFFSAFVVWNKTRDVHLIFLVLFIVASKGMDLRKLMRFYAIFALEALVVSIALSFVVFPESGITSIKDALLGKYAFDYMGTEACILFSILMAAALNSDRKTVVRIVLIAACFLCAALSFFFLFARRSAILMVLLAIGLIVDEKEPCGVTKLLSRQEASWFVAAFPIVLFCLSNDALSGFGFGLTGSVFSKIASIFNYSALACLGVLYVRSVLLWDGNKGDIFPWASFLLFSVYLLFEVQPVYLEFNCSLLLLSVGLNRGFFTLSKEKTVRESFEDENG